MLYRRTTWAEEQVTIIVQEICRWHTIFSARHSKCNDLLGNFEWMSSFYPFYDGDSRQQQVTIPWHDDRKDSLRTGNQRIPKTNEQWFPFPFISWINKDWWWWWWWCQSHVDMRYKKSLIRTMLHRTYRFSSSWKSVIRECGYLKGKFFKLGYPDSLVDATVTFFLNSVFMEKHQV